MEKIEMIKRVIKAIENGDFDLLDVKEKHGRDLSWTLSIKFLIKKEIEDIKKQSVTIN